MNISFESKGDFEHIRSWLDDVSKRTPTESLNKIAREGEQSLASNTPKNTGQTASGWKSQIKTKGSTSEISWVNNAHPESQVNLAKLIDQGHGTGTGGYVPPKPYIQKSMDSVWKTAGDNIYKELVE